MHIYAAEASIDGLAERIMANQSIAYSTQLSPWTPAEQEAVQANLLRTNFASAAKGMKSVGSVGDNDLYFTKSILVSTNWNKNDDVFSPMPVWAARHTPSHKPTNLEHDETRLVGHITETWALDGDGNLIPDNTVVDDLPGFYHLANGAVIYMNWQDDDLVARTSELIGQIEAGQKYVSMEALFSGFDYAVVTPEQQYHVVARTQDTAFLTKHLRVYGGKGEFDGCKVGRLLRNITFSGKGYVDKPANPFSVLFTDKPSFDMAAASIENPFKRESGVSISCSSHSSIDDNNDQKVETQSMSADTLSVEFLQKANDKLESRASELEAKVAELTEAASKAGVASLETKVADLEGKLEAAQTALTEAKATIDTLTSDKEGLATQLTEANDAKAALEKEAEEAKAAQVQADRIAHLVDGGIEKSQAEEKVATFAALDDDQFKTVAEALIEAASKMHGDKDKDKEEKGKASEEDPAEDPAETSASEDTLNDAEPTDDGPSMAADASDETEDEAEATRAELRELLGHRLGRDTGTEASE